MAKTISELSDEIFAVKLAIKNHNEQIDALKDEQDRLEKLLVEAAEAQGLERGGGKTSTFKIEPHTVPQVTDWDALYKFIARNKYYHLLQRRLSTTSFTELWEQGKNVPGTEKFTKTKVTVKGAD
jgi:hypothetical protein